MKYFLTICCQRNEREFIEKQRGEVIEKQFQASRMSWHGTNISDCFKNIINFFGPSRSLTEHLILSAHNYSFNI